MIKSLTNPKPPFFSVIIPTYNREKRVLRAINSVLEQDFQDFEIIVIDDASTDDTATVVKAIVDDRIKYFRNAVNSERSYSRNFGVEKSKGKYVCFLDSDDYFFENHLALHYRAIEEKDFTVALFFSNTLNENGLGQQFSRVCPPYNGKRKFHYLLNFTFNPQRVSVHRDVFNCLKFDTEVVGLEDLDLWLRIALKYNIYHINEVTGAYVLSDVSYTNAELNRHEKELVKFKVIFNKKELKYKLPLFTKWRLLSMCHFHIAHIYQKEKKLTKMYKSIVKSFFLYPKGYNGKTNKILIVMFIKSFRYAFKKKNSKSNSEVK